MVFIESKAYCINFIKLILSYLKINDYYNFYVNHLF